MITALFANGNSRTRQKLKELEKQAKADKATTVALRIQGIMLSMDGYTSGDIAKLLRVSSSDVRFGFISGMIMDKKGCWKDIAGDVRRS